MSQNPQPQGNQQAPEKQYVIRMKPECGRMLLGRVWTTQDGVTARTRPRDPDDRENVTEEYLEARTRDENGGWSDGPTTTVKHSAIARYLVGSPDGKPHRILDGAKMVKTEGGNDTDEAGMDRTFRSSWSPAVVAGVTDDCPFEIVKVVN